MVIPSHSPCSAPKGKTETVIYSIKCAQSADFEKIKKVPLFSLHQEQNVFSKHAFHLSRSGRNVMVWLIHLCTWYKQMQGHMHLWPCGCVLYWLWISDFDTCVCVCACVYVCVCMHVWFRCCCFVSWDLNCLHKVTDYTSTTITTSCGHCHCHFQLALSPPA